MLLQDSIIPNFFFILWNGSGVGGEELNCSALNCSLSNCWSPNVIYAVVVRIPAFVMIPLEQNAAEFPLQLHHSRQDLGITAAVLAAIATSAVAASAAGLAISQGV